MRLSRLLFFGPVAGLGAWTVTGGSVCWALTDWHKAAITINEDPPSVIARNARFF